MSPIVDALLRESSSEWLSLEEDEKIDFTNCEIRGSDDCSFRIPENAMALAFTMGGPLAQPELLEKQLAGQFR